ncbi:MAG: hypothetical protein KGI97_05315, partial [Alphaproteobacteria bacterium]|nr:hypothetical protein [Alphaproteobacteria bacterium]
ADSAAAIKGIESRLDKLESRDATHKTVRHAAPHKTARKAPRRATRHAAAPRWILRAALPGQAWVATSATSRDLHHLRVGDTLEGIGRVTAIEASGNGWIVRGTAGEIR